MDETLLSKLPYLIFYFADINMLIFNSNVSAMAISCSLFYGDHCFKKGCPQNVISRLSDKRASS